MHGFTSRTIRYLGILTISFRLETGRGTPRDENKLNTFLDSGKDMSKRLNAFQEETTLTFFGNRVQAITCLIC